MSAQKRILIQAGVSPMTHRALRAIASRRGLTITSLVREQLVLIAKHRITEDRIAPKLKEIGRRLDLIEKALGGGMGLRALADSNGALLRLGR
jgi:hypothetical protein